MGSTSTKYEEQEKQMSRIVYSQAIGPDLHTTTAGIDALSPGSTE
jgi:hypothetical protein